MMLKFAAGFIFFLCITALSSWKLEGFSTLESQGFNLSEPVIQRQEIHVLKHAGLNRTVGLEAKGDEEEFENKHWNYLSRKSRGRGANGGANIARRPPKVKNAGSSLVRPPFFQSLTVILAFPSLLLKLL